MAKQHSSSTILEGYHDLNEDRARRMEDLLAGKHDVPALLREAQSIIREGSNSITPLLGAIGSQRRPADRQPYIAAVAETQSATLALIETLAPVLEQTAVSAPNETVHAIEMIMSSSLGLKRYKNADFEPKLDEAQANLGRIGADALMNVNAWTREESWLRSARHLVPYAAPQTRHDLFARSQEINNDTPAVRSLQHDLRSLRRSASFTETPAV